MSKDNSKVVCPNCQNVVSDPYSTRCPRCMSALIKFGCQGSCSKCIIKKKCK